MRILLLYDNFIRDYRGLLLLGEYLEQMGHKVWLKATWDNPFEFCWSQNVQAVVTGQIAEWATHKIGKYCSDNNILLIINTSEPVTAEKNFSLLITYNTSELNEKIIAMQSIGIAPTYNFIKSHASLLEKNKYKFIGYPRTDISFNSELRETENQCFIEKYNLNKYNKKYLFISSFLLDGAFDGVPQQDLNRWDFGEIQKRTVDLLAQNMKILKQFLDEGLGENDVLIIKKHPWDCSSFFEENFSSDKCIILDNSEFITSCMAVADTIIHTYSTASFEAWLMSKPTIAIYLNEYWSVAPLHMKHENVTYDYESFIKLIHNPKVVSSYNNDDLFAGLMDGKATYRLAKEISALKPMKKVRMPLSPSGIKLRMTSSIKYNNLNNGNFFYDVNALAKKHTKQYDFFSWENQRSSVNKLYKDKIKKFVKSQINSY